MADKTNEHCRIMCWFFADLAKYCGKRSRLGSAFSLLRTALPRDSESADPDLKTRIFLFCYFVSWTCSKFGSNRASRRLCRGKMVVLSMCCRFSVGTFSSNVHDDTCGKNLFTRILWMALPSLLRGAPFHVLVAVLVFPEYLE